MHRLITINHYYHMIFNNLSKYAYWIFWSFIVGGMLIAGLIMAPIGFYQMPLLVPEEISANAHAYASILFTKFFSVYFPLCSVSFILITLLEQWRIHIEWRERRLIVICRELLLITGNGLWLYLMISMVPGMQEMVMNPEKWSDHDVRAQFQQLHDLSRWISQAGLIVTLMLPWFSRSSGFLETLEQQ